MAIERDEKLLNGSGLAKYTELLKLKLDGITTSVAGDIHTAVTTILGDATSSGDTLGELEDRIEAIEGTINNTLDEDGESGILERLDNLEDAADTLDGQVSDLQNKDDELEEAIDGITTTISGIEDSIDGITTTIEGLGSTYKALQSATTITATAGSYFSQLEQDAQGVITGTTSAFPTASTTNNGMVRMADGAGSYTVYDAQQVDGLIAGVSGDVTGLTTTYKKLQTAVTNPTASGSTLTFISGITQDAQGVIAPLAATVPTASTNGLGVVQMASGATTAVVYDSKQVDDAIAAQAAAAFVAAITPTLPTAGDENTIYFIPNASGTTPNYYVEYMYVNDGWEVVGNTELTIETLSDNEITSIFNTAFNPIM